MRTVEAKLRFQAPAKINLTLAVLGLRADGFHEIESWVVPVRLLDVLEFEAAADLSLTVEASDDAHVPDDARNLVWQAAVALARAAGREPSGRVRLVKSIPVGAGLGGGSSDAAATLRGLNALWGLGWPVARLAEVAAGIGSDAPMFLEPQAAVIRGRGERVEPLGRGVSAGAAGWLVLITPVFGVSTAAVYAAWSQTTIDRDCDRPGTPWRDRSCDSLTLMPRLFNDLEPAAFAVEPRLAALHGLLDGLGGRIVRMTGSGSCLFTLFDAEAAAIEWRDRARLRLGTTAKAEVLRTLRTYSDA
ncbi:MAG: 4-(cytidine 5'-diphospho)-2-C-methyl-D-erythritol kinase [Phycisphaerae bacterium]